MAKIPQSPLSPSEESGERDNGTSKPTLTLRNHGNDDDDDEHHHHHKPCQVAKPCPAHMPRLRPANAVADDKESRLSISSRSDSGAGSIPDASSQHDHRDSFPRQSQDLPSNPTYAAWQYYNSPHPPRRNDGRDMEKHIPVQSYSSHEPLSVHMTLGTEDSSNEESNPEEHASSLLVYLLLLAPLLSLPTSLYTLLALILLLLTFPISFYLDPSTRLSAWISSYLLPPLNIHLTLLHYNTSFPSPCHRHLNTLLLILTNLFLPLYSLPITCAAWTAAIFWAYAAMLGNPAKENGREAPGFSEALGSGEREWGASNASAVFRVARWWIWWLELPFRDRGGEREVEDGPDYGRDG